MLDEFLPAIEEVQADGAVVLLKWDGLRCAKKYTVVVTNADVDYVWREDSDDMTHSLQRALEDYKAARGL
jgi:hypothetical protein